MKAFQQITENPIKGLKIQFSYLQLSINNCFKYIVCLPSEQTKKLEVASNYFVT